jgi:tetratricopeptide (TPR) repeat protein
MVISDPRAEQYLEKATSMEPENSSTLLLLANVELLDRNYDKAIFNCRKAHSLAQDSHAMAHYIAARAFEHQNRTADATTEFRTFLVEEPTGDRADSVRKQLSTLKPYICGEPKPMLCGLPDETKRKRRSLSRPPDKKC